jgi:4-hydroxyacetophenone monooxygenase
MRLNPTPERLTLADDEIRAAVTDAAVAPLVCAIAQLTGDLSVLRPELQPDMTKIFEPNAGYSDERLALARDVATDALIRYRDAGSTPAATPTGDALRRLLDFIGGGTVDDDYVPLLREELALDGHDLRAPDWRAADVAPDRAFRVAIVGAGMSGIVLAHRLAQAGIAFTIFEKNEEVGGTWWENTYPGCRVDIQNHFYSYSFAQTNEWPGFFSTQPVLLDYFRSVVDQLGLREHIVFSTEVLGAELDEASQQWQVRLRTATGNGDGEGGERTETFDAIVSAVGQLNRPKLPDLPGIDRFAGEWFHSARWDHVVDLAGKRVGIIGTGASAAQFIPVVAEQAAHTTIFQRTPPWLLPVENYMDDLPASLRTLVRYLPEYGRWDRLWVFWRTHEALLKMAEVDPQWDGGERSVSAANDMLRELFSMYYRLMFADRPDLLEKALPQYPPIAKRVVLDNGAYPLALKRDDVELDTEKILEITEHGVRTVDGVEHVFDVLIYGTGFEASKFLTPMQLRGVGGVDLHEEWGGDARAYLGIMVPDFPNVFLMYGPNTNIVINGSIIYFSEAEAHFIVEAIRLLLQCGDRSLDPRHDVHDAYNERIDAGNRSMAWGVSRVNSWYKNDFGRVAQNWPFSLLEYWQQTRRPDPADFLLR